MKGKEIKEEGDRERKKKSRQRKRKKQTKKRKRRREREKKNNHDIREMKIFDFFLNHSFQGQQKRKRK